jgi:beta-lactamase superfamily II metal-dependent hydrolase
MVEVYTVDAGHGDCILIVSNGTSILIDSGPKEFKFRRQVKNTLEILLPNKIVDLAIVTHNDDDHIGGFKTLLSAKTIIVKKILFNGVDCLNKILGRNTSKISYRQDKELSKFLISSDIEIISMYYSPDIKSKLLIGEFSVTIISPNHDALVKLNGWKEQEDKKQRRRKIAGITKKELTIMEYLESLDEDKFESDTSITNRSSLAVIIETDGFRGLFLGDSHSKEIEEYFSSSPTIDSYFDVIKISHHGSNKNTSNKLLNIFNCNQYIICANKSGRHAHPDNLLMARLIKANKSPLIHFSNDSNEIRSMISELEAKASFSFPVQGVNRIIYGQN